MIRNLDISLKIILFIPYQNGVLRHMFFKYVLIFKEIWFIFKSNYQNYVIHIDTYGTVYMQPHLDGFKYIFNRLRSEKRKLNVLLKSV